MSCLTTFSFAQPVLMIPLAIVLTATLALYLTVATTMRAADNLLASCLLLLVLGKLWGQWCRWIEEAAAAQRPAPCLAIIRHQPSFIDWYLEAIRYLESPEVAAKLRSIRFNRDLVRKNTLVRIDEILRRAEERDRIARSAAQAATEAAAAVWMPRLESAQQRCEELQQEKEEVQRELKSERDNVQELQARCELLENKERDLEKENATLKGVQEKLVSQCQTHDNELAEKRQEAERHGREVRALKQRDQFLSGWNEQLRSINGDLKKKVAKIEQEQEVLEKTNARQREELNKLYKIFEGLQQGTDPTTRPAKLRTPSPKDALEDSSESPASAETESTEQPVLLHQPELLTNGPVTNEIREGVDEYLARGFESGYTAFLGSGANGVVREWRRPGGSGQVLAAKMLKLDEQTGGDPAWMKNPDLREKVEFAGVLMKREAKFLIRELKNTPHIISCEMFRVHPNGYNMTMLLERMTGNAHDLAAQGFGGKMDHRLGRTFLEQCSLGLSHVHRKGIIHYDIKAANIAYKVLAPGVYNFALIDFNMSVTRAEISEPWVGAAGTPGYMAPEVFRNTSRKGCKSDIFSLYVTLAELVGLGNDPARYINNLNGENFLGCLHTGIRSGVNSWDWADMAHEDPDKRPSAEAVYKRAHLSAELQRWSGSLTYGGLWVEDRAARNDAVFTMLNSQGWDIKQVAVFFREHMSLMQQGVVTIS